MARSRDSNLTFTANYNVGAAVHPDQIDLTGVRVSLIAVDPQT